MINEASLFGDDFKIEIVFLVGVSVVRARLSDSMASLALFRLVIAHPFVAARLNRGLIA